MNDSELRDRLLELERITPELEAKYREGMKAILDRPLTPVSRVACMLAMLMGIGFFILFSTVAIAVTWLEPGFPIACQIFFGVGALFGLAFAVIMFTVLRRGSIDLRQWQSLTLRQFRTVHPAVFGLAWTFTVLLTVACLMMGTRMADAAHGNQMILGGLVSMVLFGIPIMILSVATESDLFLREKFLRVEMQLAELKELVTSEGSDRSHGDPPSG